MGASTQTSDALRLRDEWLALQVKPRSELLVASVLNGKGYENLLPLYDRGNRNRSRCRNANKVPLFPGYVFCRFSTNASGRIITTPGVIRIVGNGRTPIPLPDHEIAALKRIVEYGVEVEPCDFKTGDIVTIVCGPLRGVRGSVFSWKGKHRLVVSVELLQRSVWVTVESEWVRLEARSAVPRVTSQPGGWRS